MDEPDLRLFNEKVAALKSHWQAGNGKCTLVAMGQAAQHVKLLHYDAGPEATYVIVSRQIPDARPIERLEVTIGFAPSVPGTALIYDLTAETMQGKARPFVCRFHKNLVRVYALLPCQIEGANVQAVSGAGGQQLQIAFLDGRGEVIRAALPLELCLQHALHSTTSYLTTDTTGRCLAPLAAPDSVPAAKYVIRSLLTGQNYAVAAP